jgi:dTDP-4-amino-4,6-dideoxygalactose transaminase
VHLQPAFKNLGYKIGDFPVSERIAKQVLSLPMHSYLTDEQINKVASALKQVTAEMVTE